MGGYVHRCSDWPCLLLRLFLSTAYRALLMTFAGVSSPNMLSHIICVCLRVSMQGVHVLVTGLSVWSLTLLGDDGSQLSAAGGSFLL